MNSLDISILALLLFFVIRGLMRGFFKEIASIVGILLGIYLGYTYQRPLTDIAVRLGLTQSPGLGLGCFLVTFLLSYVLVRVLAWLLTSLIGSGALGFANRVAGAGLAVLKAVLITCVGVALLNFVLPSDSSLLKGSRLAPLALRVYQGVSSKITPDMYKNWKQKFHYELPKKNKESTV